MVAIRLCAAAVLSLLGSVALAADLPVATPPGLYDHPVLVIDPGMHTAAINDADADASGRWAVSASDDKTLRIWSLTDGQSVRTIRLPAGPGYVGQAYAAAISPDGALIAAGGWTRKGDSDQQEQIYLFDRASGGLVQRIGGLPDVVDHLAFSLDGQRLAATLYGGGLRIYARAKSWTEVDRDEAYDDASYGAAFAHDGRLATTAFDGKVRLYASALVGDVRPTAAVVSPGERQPYGIAFSPDGARIAVGYDDGVSVAILNGRTLAPLRGPAIDGIQGGDLDIVAWSRDGQTLFAAGGHQQGGGFPILAWSDAGNGARRVLPAGRDIVASLVALPGGDLLAAAADPWLARLRPDGGARWLHDRPQADFRGQVDRLSVSGSGALIDFAAFGRGAARFDLAARMLRLGAPTDGRTTPPRQTGLPIGGWRNTTDATLGGRRLPLDSDETSFSLAVHPAGDRFVLGTERWLRAFDAKGAPLWQHPAPEAVWAVNITGDGRLVVAAYGDGTIRWHRMSDGVELLAFMPLPDGINWAAWTPEGFYAATPGARGLLRWHVNHGWDAAADSVPVEDIPGSYRPAVLPLVLQELETPRALGLADLAEHNRQVALRTHSEVPPGARLHLLTIGIGAYNDEYAKNLRLHFADRDASDVASAIDGTQGSLYAKVDVQLLRNDEADKGGIMAALATLRRQMRSGGGDDLAVVHFSGHGALVDGALYLLPYDVDARDDVGIEATGLSIGDFRQQLALLARYGRVLVLLDACHSGAMTADGAALPMDSTALRVALAAPNVTVITSSSGGAASLEDPAWQHGAFTKALLDALADPTADPGHTGLIGANELAHYLVQHVASLTDGKQIPNMEVRYDTTLFVAGP